MRVFKVLLLLSLAYLTARFCHKETAGFRMSKVQGNLFSEQWVVPYTPDIEKILSQKFSYFGRGLQSFAFLSEDGKTILKLINRQSRKEKSFTSYRIAYDELHQETGLLFAHLSATDTIKKKITIKDKLHIEHSLDLDKTAFLLQKKADLVYPQLLEWKKSGNLKAAKEAISSLFSLFAVKMGRNIADNDPLIRTNFGFIGTTAIQIDVGPFFYGETSIEEIDRVAASLKNWLHSHYAELLPFCEEQLICLKNF